MNLTIGAIDYTWSSIQDQAGASYQYPTPLGSFSRVDLSGPAVYRWVIYQQEPGDLRRLYIGEADRLGRRINGYLNPGPSQLTNQRLKGEFDEELARGNHVRLETLQFRRFDIDGISLSLCDLSDKMVRRFLEQLFAAYYSRSGYTLLNM